MKRNKHATNIVLVVLYRFLTKNQVRNRRWAALQRMLTENDSHWSEEAMRERAPLEYQQLVGRFLTQQEREEAARPDMSNCSLSKIILDHMDLDREREERKRQQEEEEEVEVDSDSDEEEAGTEEEGLGRLEGGREFLKEQFVKQRYQSFLAGQDPGVDYRAIDTDDTLDDLEAQQRDAEERYFDDSDNDE